MVASWTWLAKIGTAVNESPSCCYVPTQNLRVLTQFGTRHFDRRIPRWRSLCPLQGFGTWPGRGGPNTRPLADETDDRRTRNARLYRLPPSRYMTRSRTFPVNARSASGFLALQLPCHVVGDQVIQSTGNALLGATGLQSRAQHLESVMSEGGVVGDITRVGAAVRQRHYHCIGHRRVLLQSLRMINCHCCGSSQTNREYSPLGTRSP